MKGYLGETDVTDESNTDPQFMALQYIMLYGGIDGAHHKDWVLDQVARILNGAPVTVKLAKWDDGTENIRYSVGESKQYHEWVKTLRGEWDEDEECFEYGYEEGIAP